MTISFGVSPIGWINDDMPELGGETPLETVLADAQAIGFSGIELGGKFPRDPAELAPLLDRHSLSLVGGWYSTNLLDRSAEEEIAALDRHLSLLKAMRCDVFIAAETSNAIHCDRTRGLSEAPRLDDDGWREFGHRMSTVAEHVASHGLKFAYHHHLGTVVERADDLDRFIAHSSAAVGLTVDTGHAVLGEIDPVALIRRHPGRVAHVHCKDIRLEVFGALERRDGSFLDGVLGGMFTVPGDGYLDYGDVMRALADTGFAGWIIVEAEQDPAIADPRRYGEIGLRTLERAAAAAGLSRRSQ